VQHDSAIAAVVSASDGGIILTEAGSLASPHGVIDRLGHHASVVSRGIGGNVFAAASRAGDISILAPEGVLRRFAVPDAVVSALAISGDGGMVAVGDWSGTVRMYDLR